MPGVGLGEEKPAVILCESGGQDYRLCRSMGILAGTGQVDSICLQVHKGVQGNSHPSSIINTPPVFRWPITNLLWKFRGVFWPYPFDTQQKPTHKSFRKIHNTQGWGCGWGAAERRRFRTLFRPRMTYLALSMHHKKNTVLFSYISYKTNFPKMTQLIN